MVISHRYPACPHLNNSNFLLLEELSALILRYISFWKTFKPKMSQEGRDLQSHFGMIVLVWRIQLLSAVLCTSSKEPCPSCSAPACLQFLIKKGFTPLPLCPGSPTACEEQVISELWHSKLTEQASQKSLGGMI